MKNLYIIRIRIDSENKRIESHPGVFLLVNDRSPYVYGHDLERFSKTLRETGFEITYSKESPDYDPEIIDLIEIEETGGGFWEALPKLFMQFVNEEYDRLWKG